MHEANAIGALNAHGTTQRRYGQMRQERRYRRGGGASSVLLALLAGACGSSRDDATSLLVDQGLVSSDEQTERRPSAQAYTLFEADPVRPIAVLEQSGLVAVTNTVDGYLELLRPTRGSAAPCGAVQVGLEPVAVAVVDERASSAELWVVNQLSDSVSVVTLDTARCRGEVTRTLQVGDEPRDIVVARDAAGRSRVFVATAHRGQHHPLESARDGADLITPPSQKAARGLADVLVFDAAAPDAAPAVVNLFADRPRALAVADGVVYAASFLSGNQTTTIPAETAAVRGLDSIHRLLARDESGNPIEQDGELLLSPEARGVASIEGGLPAVAGRGRCVPDPRDEDPNIGVQRLCVQTDAQNRAEHVFVQTPGAVHPSCQCTSGDGTLQPATGLIVKFFDSPAVCGTAFTTFPDGTRGCWLDRDPESARTSAVGAERMPAPLAWNDQVRFSLPDRDVFAIRVDDLEVARSFSGVGTVLFGLAVQPGTGKVFVTNTDANNSTRFEGHGQSSSSTLIGHLHESRITVLDPSATDEAAVVPVHLNTHIDYSRCCDKDASENEKSFAFPTAGVFSADGSRFYFSALGSDKVGILSAAAVTAGFDQDAARASDDLREIFLNDDVTAPSGPVGLALDAQRGRLYVKTHFDNELVVIDTEGESITGRVRLHDPEPEVVSRGRSVLYNARLTSSHGDSACASCHVFGDLDGLAWDLGDPDAATVTNPGPFRGPKLDVADFRSNKGPMTTQTLRGMDNHGALHWRGDRTRRSQDLTGAQPNFGSLDELASFIEFDVAVRGLNGNDVELAPEVFEDFARFALQLTLPPNPLRHLDDTLTPEQNEARALYFGCASMTDEQFDSHTCTGLDGTTVGIDAATDGCLCQRNPFVDLLRSVPTVLDFAGPFAARLADAEFRTRLEALAADTSELPEARRQEVASAAADFSAGNTAWLTADLETDAHGFLSESLGTALSRAGGGLFTVLAASNEHQTSTAASLATLIFDALPADAVSAEVPRDRDGLAQLVETLAQVAFFSEGARVDEQNRGTSAFIDLLTGCDITEPAACNLRVTDGFLTCHGCHTLDPNGNAEFGVERPGFFGTDGRYSVEGESQVFKIPHLRNMYQKTGMFGSTRDPFFLPESVLGARSGGFFAPDTAFTGEQVRGFGFLHDGGVDTLHRFHGAGAFRRGDGNDDALDPVFPRESERAACIQRFRRAPSSAFEAAPEPVRGLLGLCVESGPLPEACFGDPSSAECQAALPAAGEAFGVPDLPQRYGEDILPLCFQLGSMLEGGVESGVCYPSGLRERSHLESFMLAFDTNLKPMVGQQLTLGSSFDAANVAPLLAAAAARDCDLAVRQGDHGYVVERPDAQNPGASRIEDRRGARQRLDELSFERAPVTLTCHPPRSERAEARRAAFDRSEHRR